MSNEKIIKYYTINKYHKYKYLISNKTIFCDDKKIEKILNFKMNAN